MFRLILSLLLLRIVNCIYLQDLPSWYLPKRGDETANGQYSWTEEWYDRMPIDHFAYADNRTFRLRYLLNVDYFVPQGPILFYTGNEGSIDGFALNTGFMWDLAPQLSAALVFAEHRYYGKTKPFGNNSFTSVTNLGYLSSEQALADFAKLIIFLKNQKLKGAMNSPVIAFGGSYGGMLAAWLRIKYPHVVEGSIAASAPVFWFPNTSVPEDIYDRIVTRSFVSSGCVEKHVYESWNALENLSKTEDGRKFLNDLFHLDPKSVIGKADDISFLKSFIKEAFESMAMVNYPYPTNFLAPLPEWPVKAACRFFNSSEARLDEELASDLYAFVNLYYNYTGTKPTLCANPKNCEDSAFSALGDPLGWPWQACTEMVMQQCSSGPPNDFFWKDCPFTIEGAIRGCQEQFGKIGYTSSLHRPSWAILNYGDRYPTASNIIFSNGYLDPWSGGGWSLTPKTVGSLVSIIIEDGAHHYDLRGSHPKDTDAVKAARTLEKMYIKKWIKQARISRKLKLKDKVKKAPA